MANAVAHLFDVTQGDQGVLIVFCDVVTEADPNFLGSTGINATFLSTPEEIKIALIQQIKQYLSDNGYPVAENETLLILGL